MWLYILSLLKKKKLYAYGLRDEIKKNFGWEHGLITSYVVLYKLEKDGLIKSEFEERRKYYKISEKGRKELKKAKRYLLGLYRRL
jgi:DNA-binding PadR family transcriptional regulator